MAGYNVSASTEEDTFTKKITVTSDEAKCDYAKKGNGYARITKLEY